jgi:geranylgeranyl reductase family protein
MKYDVIIIGGGPAGSTLGFLLASRGVSVAIVDKSTFPRNKLCGGLLARKSRDLYEKIFSCGLQEMIIDRTETVNFYLKTRQVSTNNIPELEFIDRISFDAKLIKLYLAAGGKLYENERVTPKKISQNKLLLSSNKELEYKVLVGADGALSQVAKVIQPNYMPNGFCLELTAFSDAYKAGDPTGIFFNYVKNGYIWSFPHGDNATLFGIGAAISQSNKLKAVFDDFLASRHEIQSTSRLEGAFIPSGNYLKKPINPELNALLIGDAAGLINPITGEGLYYSAVSAVFAYQAIHSFLAEKQDLCDSYMKNVECIHNNINFQKFINFFWKHSSAKSLYFKTFGKIERVNRFVCKKYIVTSDAGLSNKLENKCTSALLKRQAE